MAAVKVPHLRVALNALKPVPAILLFARHVLVSVTANPTAFPSPPVPLAQLAADIAALENAQTATATHARGTYETRDQMKAVLLRDLHLMAAYVQQVADGSPAQAQNIIEISGLSVKKPATHHRADLTLEYVSGGAVRATARAVKGAGAYEWQFAPASGTWEWAPPSTSSRTTIMNLPRNTILSFRYRAVTKTGPTDWSLTASVAVL